jgi:hypothetical protein
MNVPRRDSGQRGTRDGKKSTGRASPSHPTGIDGLRILVAEGDAETRWLVVEALLREGYDVAAVACDGRLILKVAHR